MQKAIKKLGMPSLAVVLISIFPAIFLYCRNANEAGFIEIMPVVLLSAGIGFILFFISLIVIYSANKSALIASLFMAIITNFVLLEKILKLVFPSLRYWHTVPIFFVIGLHIAFFICKFMPQELSKDIIKVICFVLGILLLINIVISIPKVLGYIQAQQELKGSQIEKQGLQTIEDEEKPNIYMFLFDEYANFPQMQEYYDYDNEPLKDFLTENNFCISYTSHNESFQTVTILTNLMNLDYIVDDSMSESEKTVLRQKGKLFDLMRQHGYTVNILEDGNFLGGHLPEQEAIYADAVTANGETLKDLCIQQSIIYPFWRANTVESINKIMKLVDYLSKKDSLPKADTFTMVYFSFPHAPFLVDENGAPIPLSQSTNWEDNQYYLGQYKYATKIMIQMIDNIITNDPNSIIILQSDHGARALTDKNFMEKFPIKVMTNPLNAVYFQGKEQLDIEGQSSVNTLRIILNRLLGMDYEILTVPEVGWKLS